MMLKCQLRHKCFEDSGRDIVEEETEHILKDVYYAQQFTFGEVNY